MVFLRVRKIRIFLLSAFLGDFSHSLLKMLEHCIAQESLVSFTPLSSGHSHHIEFGSSAWSPCVFICIAQDTRFLFVLYREYSLVLLMDF